MIVNLLDLLVEVIVRRFPLALVFGLENVSGEALQFANLVLDLLSLQVDGVGSACDSFEVGAQDGVELLDDDAGTLKVFKHSHHVNGSGEDVLGRLEVPSSDSELTLDVPSSEVELALPLLEDVLTLADQHDGLLGPFLEDPGDVDLRLDLVTDLMGNGVQDIFHFLLLLVDEPGDGPDELETGQKRGKGFLDN
jgi:hypothetical protein